MIELSLEALPEFRYFDPKHLSSTLDHHILRSSVSTLTHNSGLSGNANTHVLKSVDAVSNSQVGDGFTPGLIAVGGAS